MKHLLLLLILPFILFSRTIEINSSKSIMKTMIGVQPGDTIKLQEGEYHETIVVSNSITILGSNPYKTKIIGDGRGNAVELKSGAIIKGITITKGGVGVFSEARDVKIVECIISGNLRNGIMAVKVLPHIENSIIMSNSGFGIHAIGIKMVPKETFLNLTIIKNSKGGIYYEGNTSFSIMESVISKNGVKEIVYKDKKPIISQSILSPMPKEFANDNVAVKPSYRALRGKNKDFRIESSLGEKGIIFSN